MSPAMHAPLTSLKATCVSTKRSRCQAGPHWPGSTLLEWRGAGYTESTGKVATMRRAIGIVGALVALLVWTSSVQPTLAQTAAEVRLLELDQEHGLGRY